MRNIYSILDYDEIRNSLVEYAHSELAIIRFRSLSIIPEKKNLEYELSILKEASEVIASFSSAPITSSKNLLSLIELAKKGGVLTPLDFEAFASDVLTANKLVFYLNKIPSSYKLIGEKKKELFDLSNIEKKIHSIIAPDLRIYDHASPLIEKTRRNIDKLEKEVSSLINKEASRYSDYLTTNTITIRDGHMVLPIKSAYKNKVPGIIHDVSDSEQTVFIEPSSIVEINNEIIYQKSVELEEIHRLLKELTNYVLLDENKIISNNRLIGYFDFVFAKANYALDNDDFVVNTSSDGTLSLINARHPLIKKDEVVANSYYLDKENRILLISGPNAGGKSVCLKSVGLLSLMHLSGLALPAKEGSSIPYFKNIYLDIGDSQSLSDNLSTFSGHIRNLSYITSNARENDLVLIDEIGTGTSPQEGEALAIAIIERLLNRKCLALVSSHFEGLKAYALSHNGIKNASMVFDLKTLTPTYHLLMGSPGKSYGLEMAKRYNIDEEIISRAKKYLSIGDNTSLNEALEKLNNQESELENKLKENAELSSMLKKKILEEENAKRLYEEKKEKLSIEAAEIKEKLIRDAIDEVDDIRRSLSRGDKKLGEVIDAKTKLNNMLLDDETNSAIHEEEHFKVGDYVKISSLDIVGQIKAISKNKVEIVSVDGLSITSSLDKLSPSAPINSINRKSLRNVDESLLLKSDIKMEINLIGQHVDEAILNLDKYLDDAQMRNFHEVRIIHGSGTGALRKAIHEYLKKKSFVAEFHYADLSNGGSGATIVRFK